jgi:predicted phage baseplate assembly protein
VTLPAPILDDRRFDDLVAEARSLIPRYTREWSDFNDSDPGITLLQLHAWMTDLLLYRLNQVPDRLYVKLLDLIGVHLRPAEPARTPLTFLPVDPPAPLAFVPASTAVAAAAPGDGEPPPVFETDRGVAVLGAPLDAVLVDDGVLIQNVTGANAAGTGFAPFGVAAREDAALLLGFGAAAPLPRAELLLYVRAAEATGVSSASCSEGELAPPADVWWEFWDGTSWVRAGLNRDGTLAFTRSGFISIDLRGDEARPLALATVATPHFWLRARLERAGYERAPRLSAVATNTVPATAARIVADEVVGGTDGSPSQRFRLAFTPVLEGTLALEIDEGSGFTRWTLVDDLAASARDAREYTLDRHLGLITLGDNVHGHAPVANAANPAGNVVARVYRWGGGRAGNLPAGAVVQLQTTVDGVQSATNRWPAVGGRDAETIDEAKARAPRQLSTRSRAVTAEDFEALATEAPGAAVKRAIALARAHPGYPDVPVPGSVTVIVVPDSAAPDPRPGEATLRNVCRHLDRHRLLTVDVHVTGPTYRRVRVQASLIVHPSADLGTVRRAVDEALDRYLSPLTGDEGGRGWSLGGTVSYSLVAKTALLVDGVARLQELWLFLDGERQPRCADVAIGARELVYADGHDVAVRYPDGGGGT